MKQKHSTLGITQNLGCIPYNTNKELTKGQEEGDE